MTSFIAADGSGRSTSVIPAVPAASSVTTIAFIRHLPASSSRLNETRQPGRLAIREAGLGKPHELSRITQPTFVANGDNDVMVASSQSSALAERIPNAQLTIYPDSGHGGVFQHHDKFVPAVLEFLEAA